MISFKRVSLAFVIVVSLLAAGFSLGAYVQTRADQPFISSLSDCEDALSESEDGMQKSLEAAIRMKVVGEMCADRLAACYGQDKDDGR